jgi:hypothetical protein
MRRKRRAPPLRPAILRITKSCSDAYNLLVVATALPKSKGLDMTRISGIPITSMSGYTTAQVAKAVGVSKNTLLKWLYSGVLAEPKRSRVGGVSWRVWSERDLERARKLKGTQKRGRKPKKK